MSVLLTNIRGLLSNFDDLKVTLSFAETSTDISVLTETFLSAQVPSSAIKIDGYDLMRKDRTSHGGGVAVYCKNTLNVQRLPDLEQPGFETIWFQMKSADLTFVFCCLYWPPNSAIDMTITYLMPLKRFHPTKIWPIYS